jgi:2-keto-3-deoxygluconate permease
MKIKASMEAVPGGLMTVPLLLGAVLGTWAPHLGTFFGSFTGALFAGALPLLAVFYVCVGATVSIRSLPTVLRKGGTLMASKLFLGFIAATILGHLLGSQPIAYGPLAGLSALAMVAAINDTNGGLYMALMRRYGRPEEAASYSVMALESGPFFTMVTLGVAGLSSFPWQTMLGAILPLGLGILLGNLDPEMRAFLKAGGPVLIPFFAFALGTTMDLHRVWAAGLLGLALGLTVLLVSSLVLAFVDRLGGGNGTAGVAAATTAGNAASVPLLVALANPQYASAARSATVLIASSVIVTSLLAPPLTAWWHHRVTRALPFQQGDVFDA